MMATATAEARARAAIAAWYPSTSAPTRKELESMEAALAAPTIDDALTAWFGYDWTTEGARWNARCRDGMARARRAAAAVEGPS